jgi:hypothetical protein
MEVQDGFIVGIFNACDGWCSRCRFTSYCRLFAHRAEMEAAFDPHLKPVIDAPPLPAEAGPPPPFWLRELIEDMNEAARDPISAEEWERIRPRVPEEHTFIDVRAQEYARRTSRWLKGTTLPLEENPQDPRCVISWFHFHIAAKINRSLTVRPDDDPRDVMATSDNDGSAKVALLGIDQSHAAWLELIERRAVSESEALPFIADLVWLGEALEQVRPNARAFVRPAFDEPDAIASLLAGAGGPG